MDPKLREQLIGAYAALEAKEYNEALSSAIEILEERPHELNGARVMGKAFVELGEVARGAALLAQAAARSLSVAASHDGAQGGAQRAEGLEWGASCLMEAAEAYVKGGDPLAAAQLATRVLQIGEAPLSRILRVGELLSGLERHREALSVLTRALKDFSAEARLHRALGESYERLGERGQAINAYSAVCALEPDDNEVVARVQRLLNQTVPTWHFPMMNDAPRNQAFRAAIEARVSPGMKVLDIGCGAGLLSLIAARAGAEAVYACESEPKVSEVAVEIMGRNELDDVVRVIPKRSTSMRVGVDLPERLDMLVCEIFDVSLLGEDALNTISDAKRRLLKRGAQIVPCGARVWCQLVESDELRARYHVDEAEGFDLSPFNRLRDPRVLQLDLKRFKFRALTEPCLAVSFDFEEDFSMMGEALLSAEVIESGRADGFIFWYELILDHEEAFTLSTSPHVEGTHWMQGFAPCYREQRQLNAGEQSHFNCSYRRFLLSFEQL